MVKIRPKRAWRNHIYRTGSWVTYRDVQVRWRGGVGLVNRAMSVQSIGEMEKDLLQPRVSVSNLCYLIKLLPPFPACFIYTPFFILSVFVALSNSRSLIKLFHLLTLSFLLTFYVIYTPYKCTCTTHQTTQLSPPSYRTHVLCGNTPSRHNRRLWSSRHSVVGDRDMTGGFIIEQTHML